MQQNTEYVSHSVESYIDPNRQTHELYDKVVTFRIGRSKRRRKVWYVCRSSDQTYTKTSIYDDYPEFATHMKQQHQPNVTCLNCDRSIHPNQFNKHYTACCKSNDTNIVNARKRQISELQYAQQNSDSDSDDDNVDYIDVHQQGCKLVDDLDVYEPIQHNRSVGTCAYYNPLLRIESLQYYDISCPIIIHNNEIEFAEWVPKQCEKYSEQCNVVLHGTSVHFCYDTDEPFLLEIKRYRCTKHFSKKIANDHTLHSIC